MSEQANEKPQAGAVSVDAVVSRFRIATDGQRYRVEYLRLRRFLWWSWGSWGALYTGDACCGYTPIYCTTESEARGQMAQAVREFAAKEHGWQSVG